MAAQQPCHTFGYGIAAQGAQILPATPEEPFLRIRLGDALIRTQDMRLATAEAFGGRELLDKFTSEWLKFWKKM